MYFSYIVYDRLTTKLKYAYQVSPVHPYKTKGIKILLPQPLIGKQ